MKTIYIQTHGGEYHSDDLFGVAIAIMWYKKQDQTTGITIKRSSDRIIDPNADLILDMGRKYDQSEKIFDHHQFGGAGKRENGIPYASAGLLWREFGLDLCHGDEIIAKAMDYSIMQSIDATDNGFDISEKKDENFPSVLSLSTFLSSFKINCETNEALDLVFEKLVYQIVIPFLENQMISFNVVSNCFNECLLQKDSQIIILSLYSRNIISQALDINKELFKTVMYVIYPSRDKESYNILAISQKSFMPKKPFPENWRAKDGKELELETHIQGSIFCHATGFLASHKTQEGAILLAQKALTL
jgi:uncharacterized UPF0160 family protein